jgi:UDP-N-acetylenolpyruvoylglucosamine reductase
MAFPASAEQMAALFVLLREKGEKPFIMGNGTNLLVTDGRFSRFVIKTCESAGGIRVDGQSIYAECGALLSRVAAAAMDAGLTGLEFASGIPGSVGGAVSMNAGAYGGEMRDVAIQTDYLDEGMVLRTVRGAEHGFSYRHSNFSETDAVILRTVFALEPGDQNSIGARMRELGAKRRATQPLELPSAGSAFKRPAAGYAAALIEKAGLKGFSVGGAMVSPKHAGFIVNTGRATFDDVLSLMDHIQQAVYACSGILLEPEVKIIRG